MLPPTVPVENDESLDSASAYGRNTQRLSGGLDHVSRPGLSSISSSSRGVIPTREETASLSTVSVPRNFDEPRYNLLGGAKSLTAEQIKNLDGGDELLKLVARQERGTRGFGEAITDFNAGDLPVVGDVVDTFMPISEMFKVADTVKAVDSGKQVSDQDALYAQLYLTQNERMAQRSTGGMVGDALRTMPGFMSEIYMYAKIGARVGVATDTPHGAVAGAAAGAVVGAGKAAVRVGARAVTGIMMREGAKEAAAKWSKKLVANVAGRSATRKFGRGMLEGAVKATGLQLADTALNATYNIAAGNDIFSSKQAADRYVGGNLSGDDISMAHAKLMALGDHWIEYVSEMSGGAIGDALLPNGGTMAWLGKRIDKEYGPGTAAAVKAKAQAYTGIKLLASKMTADGDPKTMFKWLKNVGYDGYFEEMLEERYGDAARGLFGLQGDEDEGRIKNMIKQAVPDKQQFMTEAISFAVPIVTALSAAKGHRWLAGQDTPEITKHLGNALMGTKELVTPHVERLGDEISSGGGNTANGVTLGDAVDSIAFLADANEQRPTGPFSRILDTALSLAEVVTSGSFAPLIRHSNIGQVLARYGREDFASRYTEIKHTLKAMAKQSPAYKGLSEAEVDAKVTALAKDYLTEVVGVARKSLVLKESALDKAVDYVDADNKEAAKQEIVKDLQARFDGKEPTLAIIPYGSGRHYHEIIVDNDRGHPISETVSRINKAADEVLFRHGIDVRRKFVNNANELTIQSMMGPEISLDEVNELKADPNSFKASMLSGELNIDPSTAGGAARLNKVLDRHTGLHASGAYGQGIYEKYDQSGTVLTSRVGYETLPDGRVYFTPKYDNSGTDADRKARLNQSESDARMLNSQLSGVDVSTDPFDIDVRMQGYKFTKDTTPPSLKFSRNVWMANQDPKVLTSAYGYTATNDADAERYIREVLFGGKMEDGVYVVGAGNLNDENQVSVRASANLYHTWEELTEHALKLWNKAERGEVYAFEAPIENFMDEVRQLVIAKLKADDGTADLLQERAFLAMLNKSDTDAPVKLFGQLFLGYNDPMTRLVVKEVIAFSEQIESLRSDLLDNPSATTAEFAKYMGFVTKLLTKRGTLDTNQFELQVNPYLSAESKDALATQLTTVANTKATEAPAPAKTEKKAPAPVSSKPVETQSPATAKPVAEKKPVVAKEPVAEEPPVAKKPVEEKPIVSQETPIKSRVANLPPPPGAAKATAPVAEAVKPEAVVAKAPVAEAVKPEVPTQEVVHSTVVGLPPAPESSEAKPKKKKHVLNVGKFKSTLSTEAIDSSLTPESTVKGAVGTPPDFFFPLNPDEFFSDGQVKSLSEQHAIISNFNDVIRDSMARIIDPSYDANLTPEAYVKRAENSDTEALNSDSSVKDTDMFDYSDSELSTMQDGNTRTLKVFKGVRNLAESIQLITGLDGYQSILELTHGTDTLPRLLEAASSDEALVSWMDSVAANETTAETALKSIVRYVNGLAAANDKDTGFTATHMADMVESMRVMYPLEANEGTLTINAASIERGSIGDFELKVKNRVNVEAKLHTLAHARIAAFNIDPAKSGKELRSKFEALMTMPGFQTREAGTANADRIAKLLSVDKSEFKTALFKFLHDFTGAPTAFFATASRKPEGRAVIASIVASPLSFWFAANSVNTNNIGSYKFMSSPNEATRKKAFEKAIKDTWLGVAEATGSLVPTNVAARPNVLKIMKLADVTDGAFAPIYKDGNLKGQAGCVSRDKFVRYVDAFLKAVGSPLTISTGGMSLFKGLTIKSDEMTHPRYVEFGNLEAPDMRLVLQQMFEQGWMYTGVYGDKTNDRFIKMPSITVEQAAKEYRALYERPSNTLLDQSVWISPETIDKMVEEYKVLKEKDDAKKASNADIRRMNAIKHEVKRVRFVTEFDRIVDGDMRFYAPKLKKGTKIPEFLLKTVAENGGSITSEQRSDPLVDRIAGDLLVSRTKRRGNDLTGGRDLSSIERYMAEIPGRKNGKIRVAVINSNFGLGDFTDGMGVFLESTVGTSFVKAEGVDFAGSEDSAHTFKPQISGTYAVGDARVPLLDKLNLVGIEQLAADPDRADAAKILKFMQEAEVDVIVFDSAEKVPSGPAYALGFLKDDRLAITSIDDLAKVKILNKTREITREVSGADFTLPLALHGDTEPSEARFAKQLQHLVWSSPNGVSYRKLIDQYIEKVAAGVQTSNMDFLTKLAIKQLKTGDDESVRLANALKTGQLSIVSPSIRSRVNLLQAVLKSMRFSVARARGPLVMRFDKPDSGRMTRPGLDNPYKLINANIDDPNVHYVTNLAATTEDAAKTAFAKLFMREFRTKNPRAFETKQTVRRGTAEDQIAAAFDDMLSTAEQVPVANAESVVVPYRYAFNIAREERPAEANELSSKVVDGVRMIAPGDALVSFNEDGSLNTDSLRKNIIQAGADGNYILLGTGFISDRIPADGVTSMSVAFLNHGFASSEVNLIELDANTVTYMGADGDGDSPNLWMIGELMDDSPEGLKNRMLSLIFDDYLTDPSIIDWSKRGIDTLHTNIITPTGEMLKYGPNAPVEAVTYANILDRVSYEWLVGQAGKDNVGTAAKINSTSMALSATGVYLQETTTLVTPNGTFVIEHTAEDAAGILDTTDSTLWNRFRMAMHVAPQMGVSRAVDDAKAFIMGHMKLSSWRMAIELAGTLFNKAILHPAGEVDASGKPTKFNYEAEFPAAAKQSIDMTVAVAKSKYLDAVDEFMVRRAGSELSPSFKRQDVRQSMVTVAARSFLSADETAAMKKALAGLPELKPAWYEARSEFVTNNTAIGAWIKLHDIGESIREFGSVADTMVVATPVKTLETFERAAETVANIKANGGLGSIKVLHPEYLSIADTIISKLQDAMPFAHPASSTLGMFVREALGSITNDKVPAVKVDSAIGTLMSQNALKTMIDGLGEDLDTKFPVERVRSLRTEYPDFFNLVAPSGQFIDALELVPVYAGDSGVVLPDALITKARASFDAMPVKLQLEVAAAALSIYDIQTSARQHSFTMLLGNPEKSQFVREFTAAIRTEFNKLSTTDSADRVLDLLTGRPSVARARVAQSTLGTEYKKYEKAAKAYADAEDVAPMNRSAVDAVAKAPETVVEKTPESNITALVKEARPPAMFAFKELAKANRAEYVLAPTTGDAKSFAVRLGAAAERADKLVSEDTTDSRIYVSLPGSGRIGAADALAAAKESIPSLLDWNNTLITDNEDNATRAHNASGEGELRKFLQSLGAKETSFPTHSEWTKAPAQATPTGWEKYAEATANPIEKIQETPVSEQLVSVPHQKAVSLTDVSSPFVSVGKDGYPVDVMLDEGGVWTAYRLGHMDVLTDEQVIAYWNRASESGITKVEAPSEYTPTYEAKGNTYSSGVPVSDDIRFMRNDYITPTVEQGEALLKIAEFLDTGSESMAELVGYAGTGKTTLIENIIRYASKDRKVFVWAPTNVAVKIIEGKLKNGHGYGKATLSTIHSGLFGEPDKSGNWVVQNGIKDNALVIIDESSMIDKEVFLAIRKSVLDARNSKVLFIGDNYQLEPVGAPSNVLSEQASPVSSKYRTKLSGVLRQAADSPVLTAATQTRINDAPMVPNKSVAKFVVHTGASDFLKAYIAALKSERTDVMMIASTNSERIRYNELARRILHPESAQSTLVVGDLITSTANSADMVNSETGTITDPGVITGIHTIKILDKLGKATTVSFERRSGVYITSGDSKIEAVVYLAPKLTMASLPHSQVFKSFTPADLQSDINEDIVTNKKGEQSLGKHVILATYAYARTGHKAQGSQAPHVFVDQSFSHKDWNAGRWYYTAITRSSDKIDLLLNPSIHKRFDLEKAQAELKQVAPKFLSRPITGLEKNAVSEEQLTRYSDPDWATREPITDQYDLPRMFTSSDDNGNKVIIDKDEVGSWMLFNESTPDGIYIKTADAISFWNKVIPTESTTLSTNAIEPARKFGDVPSYSSFTKAPDLVSAWLDSRAEDLAKEDDPKLVASNRARLATYWDKALAPFSKAQTYEEAAAAISDLDATLYGMNPRIQESMRQWALSHLPMVSAIEELDYSVVARDTVPHLKTLDPDQVDTDSEYTPGSVTLSTYPVISRFEDVLSPYRGTGASKLTNILVDEGNAMDAALGRVNRYYERTAVEWGLTGIVNRYEEHTFSIDETGKKGSYTMIGRALMDKKNADKLTDDEKKLNALIQYMAFMGLEHTKLVAGKRVFNRAEASKVYAILAPEYSADLETLKRSLPDALAEKVYARMQKALEGLELPTEEDDDLERADKERKIALAVKAAKVGTFQRVPIWSSHRGYSATDVSKNWKARKISYYVSLEDLETEMKASETNTTGNQLIAKLLKNHRAKTRLTIDTLVNESANELDTLQKFVNERAPWVMSTDSIYMRYKKQYSPHYFGSGFYGSSEREAALLVSAALDRADKTQVSKSLDEIKFEKDTKRDITKIFSLSSRSGKIRSLEETTEPMIKYMFLLKGIEYNGFSDAIALIKSGKLADMGITPDMNYVDVADLIHYELMEVLQARAESMAELDDSVNGIENPVALARALREVKDAYKDREFTNRTKTRFFKTFEEAFVVSGRRPRNMGAADAVFKYAGDIKTATKNRIILNQMVQVTDIEGHALIIPEPNLETKLTDKEQVLTPEAWTIVADRMAAWFHDSVDPKATMQENVERMIQKYVVRSKSYARVDSAYDSTPAFYAFKQDLGKDTVLDVLAGGEVAGILKHVISKPWQDPWGILNALDHLNQWMKICSLQFSLFFQMAGQEGLIAVMGHKYFTSEGGPFHTQVEWRRMLKMGHPYVLKMIADAEAIGLRFGSVANPMGLPSGMYESDIAALTDYTEKHIGKKAAGRVKAILSFSKKQSDFMFETYYNTIKLWTVYMYSNLLEAKATKAGVPYDFKEAMLPHVDYINSEVGGVNWNKYSWMTPSWKRFWSLDQFSPDWGMSAWNAAGGGLLTAQFLKNFMTPDELKFITTHRWPQMFFYVMLMVPLMVQATAFVIGKAAGTVGDDDEWLIFNNEEGRKLHANLTPLLKAIHKIPGMPAYEGFPTGERKAYIRWGKQAYETQRWLESPWNSLMSKSSQIVRWAVEQATGTSGGSVNFPLPFKDQGFIGLFQGKDGDFMGSRIGYTLQKFAPFSILAYAQNKDAAPFQILGPVTKGMGFYTAVKAYTGLLDTWARDTTYANIYRSPHVKANLESLGQSILDAAEANGYEPAKVITAAKGAVLKDYYAGLYKAINANDSVATEKWARCIIRLNGTIQSTLSSARNRNEMYGKPEKLSDDQRRMIREAFGQ